MKSIQITVSPEEAASPELERIIAEREGTDADRVRIVRRSIDARKRDCVKVTLAVDVCPPEESLPSRTYDFRFQSVASKPEIVIAGAGPAGLFAAFRLIERGWKPVIVERGKEVGERKRDIALLCRGEGLNAESNYCFGEGGAGAFSDGKLFTRSNKRGNIERALQLFRYHGASERILTDAHPHIGSDALPSIVARMRQTIVQCGGEFHFGQKLTGFILKDGRVSGVATASGDKFHGKAVILSTGHSAADIYEMFFRNHYLLEMKAFAMGVRVEHPQELINDRTYRRSPGREYLPPASYAFSAQADGRGVYSFCMCPGGCIVPASTSDDGLTVNGMSSSRRHTAFANAGVVVEVRQEDLAEHAQEGVLAGLRYRQHLERLAAIGGGGRQTAPAQRISDFMKGTPSPTLPACSYLPGIISSPLHEWLPPQLAGRLREAFRAFDRKMNGFITSEATVVGVESRSSSPVRIPRDGVTLQHPQLEGLYPCGEGSGYAGGITSSAMDGTRVAEAIAG
ncbi:MAG: NAD(P)/FAD-dependent oxidoreductase [Bacteroidales bacterium]|jgi:uncharacterized FAD-dependent dehydrogenase|nr:NAD(P)/FAD-dependent oxidoreductase [Bacteroidales bacterium]